MSNLKMVLQGYPIIHPYKWGVVGDSYVHKFSANGYHPKWRDKEVLDRDGPLAEAWMANHANGVSLIWTPMGETTLDELLKQFPVEMLGEGVEQLDLLAKCLSVGKPLSIQNHPNKAMAQVLSSLPDSIYDPNAKPEASVALTTVELLYGFRSMGEILGFIETVPLFGSFFDDAARQDLKRFMGNGSHASFRRLVLERVLMGEKNPGPGLTVAQLVCKELYEVLAGKETLTAEEEWILRLRDQYPDGDVGVFFFYILNLVELEPGKCQFIAPGIPHAYLSGEMLEFMFNSDNTLRAGLTPKLKDVTTLLEITDYDSTKSGIIKPAHLADNSQLFQFPDGAGFSVFRYGPGTYACPVDSLEFLISPDAEGSFEPGGKFGPATMWAAPAAVNEYSLTVKSGSLYRMIAA